MRRGRWVGLLAVPIWALGAIGQDPPATKVGESLGRLFGPGIRIDSVSARDTVVLRIRRAEALLGFAVVRNVIGKDQPITFLVAIDTAAVLKDVDILVYREPYGGEVAYDSWRRQFRGKTASAPLVVYRDIKSISGATISSHSVPEGVRRALADLTRWRQAGLLR